MKFLKKILIKILQKSEKVLKICIKGMGYVLKIWEICFTDQNIRCFILIHCFWEAKTVQLSWKTVQLSQKVKHKITL